MTGPPLSNRVADLAERAGEAFRRGNARTVEAAAAYLDCGRILAEAKAEAGHGQWLPVLARAGIPARTATRMMRLAANGMDPETLAERGIRAASEALGRPGKSATVADLEPPAPAGEAPAARRQAQRQDRRAHGLCLDCGKPCGGPARCETCRERVAASRRRRQALARMGEDLAPRVVEAAEAGRGLRLTAAEVAALAERGPGKGDSCAPRDQPHGQPYASAAGLRRAIAGGRDPAA